MPDADLFNLLVQLLVLAAAGFVGCYLAERLGTARIVGGLIAGLLIGPSLLGKVAPDADRWLWKGAQTELAQLASLEAEYESAVKASIISGVSEIHREILKEEYEPRIGEVASKVSRAEWAHESHTRALMIIAIVLILVACGRNAPMHGFAGLLPRATAIMLGAVALPLIGGMVLWETLGAGRFAIAFEYLSWDDWIWAAGLAALAIPISPRLLNGLGSSAADDSPSRLLPVMQAATALASIFLIVYLAAATHWLDSMGEINVPPSVPSVVLALTTFVGGFAAALAISFFGFRVLEGKRAINPSGVIGLLFSASVLPLAGAAYADVSMAVGALAAGLAFGALPSTAEIVKRHLAPIADGIALPILCAYIGTRIDIIPHFDWVWVLIALILFSDGKALGVMLVGRYVCRLDWRASMRMGTILAAGGALPLIVALMVYEAGIIDQTLFVALVIANAVTAAFAAPVLRMIDAYFGPSEPDGFSDD